MLWAGAGAEGAEPGGRQSFFALFWALRTAPAPHARRRTPRQWERLGGEWAVGPAVRLGSGGPLWARGGPGLGACPRSSSAWGRWRGPAAVAGPGARRGSVATGPGGGVAPGPGGCVGAPGGRGGRGGGLSHGGGGPGWLSWGLLGAAPAAIGCAWMAQRCGVP